MRFIMDFFSRGDGGGADFREQWSRVRCNRAPFSHWAWL
jgi:hypothetical protein